MSNPDGNNPIFDFFTDYCTINRTELVKYDYFKTIDEKWLCVMHFRFRKVHGGGDTEIESKFNAATKMMSKLAPHFQTMYAIFCGIRSEPDDNRSECGKTRRKRIFDMLVDATVIKEKPILGRPTLGLAPPEESEYIHNDEYWINCEGSPIATALARQRAILWKQQFQGYLKPNIEFTKKLEKYCETKKYPMANLSVMKFMVGSEVKYQSECTLGAYFTFGISTNELVSTKQAVERFFETVNKNRMTLRGRLGHNNMNKV